MEAIDGQQAAKLIVLLRADRSAPCQIVREVLGALEDAGVCKLRIAVSKGPARLPCTRAEARALDVPWVREEPLRSPWFEARLHCFLPFPRRPTPQDLPRLVVEREPQGIVYLLDRQRTSKVTELRRWLPAAVAGMAKPDIVVDPEPTIPHMYAVAAIHELAAAGIPRLWSSGGRQEPAAPAGARAR